MRRDPANPVPLYHRVQAVLRAKIEASEYPEGSMLPSERDLAKAYAVSRITLRQALSALERDRLIKREHGQGTFVRRRGSRGDIDTYLSGSLEDLIRPSQISRIEFIDSAEVPAPEAVAEHLGVVRGAPVRRIRRVFWNERDPFAFITNYVAVAFASRLPRGALERTPLFTILKREFGIEISAAKGTIEAALADAPLARRLRVQVASPLLFIRRAVFGLDMQPISFNVIYAPSIRYRIQIDLRNRGGRDETGVSGRDTNGKHARVAK